MLLKEFDLEEFLHIRGEEEREEGKREERKKLALCLLDVLDITTIAEKTGLSVEEIKELKKNQ